VTSVVILAAGKGTRMRSELPKVLHPILGKPMLAYVLAAAKALAPQPLVVVGHEHERVEEAFAGQARFVLQEPQKGTADAVSRALSALPEEGEALILYGDTPLLDGDELAALVRRYAERHVAALLVAATVEDPTGYGRVLLDAQGALAAIVEEKDATPAERRIRLVNTGVAVVDVRALRAFVACVGEDNAQGERYLPELFVRLARSGAGVEVYETAQPESYLGVNDRVDLAQATAVLRRRILEAWMRRGVTVEDPESTFVGPDVHLGQDVVLRPGTHLLGRTRVGAGSAIGPMSRLVDAEVGEGAEVVASFVEESAIGDRVRVGPFAHLRPGCTVEEGAEIGNFAELKNVRFGARAKVHHHAYLGDADIGAGANIGAGAITVNYDGVRKHRTVIGTGGFIGCNVNLVAPLTVGDGAYVAAGSTVNQEVPARALAIARERQRNIPGWVERRRNQPKGEEGE
jgi:bifunctional UDP-N-acetylglucosamine pyrophosphorylase/glucosamine-1-phosphate N-acetyltransferase